MHIKNQNLVSQWIMFVVDKGIWCFLIILTGNDHCYLWSSFTKSRSSWSLCFLVIFLILFYTTFLTYYILIFFSKISYFLGKGKPILIWYCCKWSQRNWCRQVSQYFSAFLPPLVWNICAPDRKFMHFQVWLHCSRLPCLWPRLQLSAWEVFIFIF